MSYLPVEWLGDRVRILDQTRLPQEEIYLEFGDYQDVVSAIKELKIRGAPAIGVAGAYAAALGALSIEVESINRFREELRDIIRDIAATRPTAKNLFYTLDRMRQATGAGDSVKEIKAALVQEATKIHGEEAASTEKLSRFGAELIKEGSTVLTHCNTGPLATTGYGTALGIIKRAWEQGKVTGVMATETRPLLQGARLTVWECRQAGIPVTLITDSMAGYFMRQGEVDCVIVGADRIAANGYTANKIGTYALAVLTNAHGIPFYVAAPTTTIDLSLTSGYQIPIEQRNPEEVTHIRGVSIAPEGTEAANPAFDITPSQYITAIITERGIIRKPFGKGIKDIV